MGSARPLGALKVISKVSKSVLKRTASQDWADATPSDRSPAAAFWTSWRQKRISVWYLQQSIQNRGVKQWFYSGDCSKLKKTGLELNVRVKSEPKCKLMHRDYLWWGGWSLGGWTPISDAESFVPSSRWNHSDLQIQQLWHMMTLPRGSI